ncbi:hypothetical protein L2E82_41969 [Cichorium intybus]|uniref:Uncharacterized protein n=1 Tax=Cichorium intybus TaxID=13427 RepID=A0ACB8ZM71_CICIN|nr:hypothetical protein L2E82_41969 [Cichorium intybus]
MHACLASIAPQRLKLSHFSLALEACIDAYPNYITDSSICSRSRCDFASSSGIAIVDFSRRAAAKKQTW